MPSREYRYGPPAWISRHVSAASGGSDPSGTCRSPEVSGAPGTPGAGAEVAGPPRGEYGCTARRAYPPASSSPSSTSTSSGRRTLGMPHDCRHPRSPPRGSPASVAPMLAVYATAPNPDDPLASLEIGERPDPEAPEGWTTVAVRAVSLNHHDLWTLRGVGISADRFPMILGCDAAGVDTSTGDEVVVHSVIASDGWEGDETLDPKRTLLSEKHQGALADLLIVPKRNVVPKPAELSFAEAACLPTAWLTAYRMLFVNSALRPGQTVLVQGASGGVATACIALARAGGYRVWATARTQAKQAAAV